MKQAHVVAHVGYAETVDSAEPDYKTPCDSCGVDPELSPTVTLWKHGRMIHHTHLCGPCCWGAAAMLDPRRWNE